MVKCVLFTFAILMLLAIHVTAQPQLPSQESEVLFPEVPRISAYEAFTKYKAGKAILIHAGGEAYERRHLIGAFNVSQDGVAKGVVKLPNFPMTRIEIFTYCY